MTLQVASEESSVLIMFTIIALPAPGSKYIVMMYDTTPVSLSVAVTNAPTGNTPSSWRVATIALLKYS
jgi:hypothetical protein